MKLLQLLIIIFATMVISVSAFADLNRPKSSVSSPMAVKSGSITVRGIQTIASVADCSSVSVTIKGNVQGTSNDTGTGYDNVTFELWDDGILKDVQTVQVKVGSVQPVAVTLSFLGKYLTGAPGVGVYSEELGLAEDPFYPTDVPGFCPVSCWISPATAKAGDYVSINAEIMDVIPNSVLAYNGDFPLVYLTDGNNDGIYTGTWKVPASNEFGPKTQFSVRVNINGNIIFCPGYVLTK